MADRARSIPTLAYIDAVRARELAGCLFAPFELPHPPNDLLNFAGGGFNNYSCPLTGDFLEVLPNQVTYRQIVCGEP